ncbi:MAG: hypothetical protein O6933_03225 [Planctomycetota bacterium]|nr:hypothetical protein [Planctomycetota bacterium]
MAVSSAARGSDRRPLVLGVATLRLTSGRVALCLAGRIAPGRCLSLGSLGAFGSAAWGFARWLLTLGVARWLLACGLIALRRAGCLAALFIIPLVAIGTLRLGEVALLQPGRGTCEAAVSSDGGRHGRCHHKSSRRGEPAETP